MPSSFEGPRAFYVNIDRGPKVEVPTFEEVSEAEKALEEPVFWQASDFVDFEGELDMAPAQIAMVPIRLEEHLLNALNGFLILGKSLDSSGEGAATVESLFRALLELGFQRGMEYAMKYPETIKAAATTE